MSAFDVQFDENFDFGGYFWQIVNFAFERHICDAKADPFIPAGVDHFVYLAHIGIQISENNW